MRPLLKKLGKVPTRKPAAWNMCPDCGIRISKNAKHCKRHAPKTPLPVPHQSGRYCHCGKQLGHNNTSGVCRQHRYDHGKPDRQQCTGCTAVLNRNNTTGYCAACVKADRTKGFK